MHGPTCIFWANLTACSLQPETIEAVAPERLNRWTPCAASLTYGFALAVGLGLGRIVALHHRSSTLFHIR